MITYDNSHQASITQVPKVQDKDQDYKLQEQHSEKSTWRHLEIFKQQGGLTYQHHTSDRGLGHTRGLQSHTDTAWCCTAPYSGNQETCSDLQHTHTHTCFRQQHYKQTDSSLSGLAYPLNSCQVLF